MLTDATIIARTRALWPALTTAVASDAFCEAWVPAARLYVGTGWGSAELDALSHLVAHYIYRIDPAGTLGTGGAGIGAVQSISTNGLSASFAAPTVAPADVELATTRPGSAYLSLRATRGFMLARVF